MSSYQVRPASVRDAKAIAQIHVAAAQAAYKDLLPDNQLSPPSVEKRQAYWREAIEYSEPQVQVVINMDGFGFPAKKVDSYRRFVGGMPIQFTGFKLFYKNDILTSPYRMMTPSEILRLYPMPIYIQYQ